MAPIGGGRWPRVADELLDARGVKIEAGDAVIYGFGVGRSVAMCEAVVLGGGHAERKGDTGWGWCTCGETWPCSEPSVSLTPSGRVRLRVVRRSYGGGEKPVVDIAPDRLVVLKPVTTVDGGHGIVSALPPSPLPTQDEAARSEIERQIGVCTDDLRSTAAPDGWAYYMPGAAPEALLADFHAYAARRLAQLRRKLRALDG